MVYPNENQRVSIRKIRDIRNGKRVRLKELIVRRDVKEGRFKNWFLTTYKFERKKFNIIGRKNILTKVNNKIVFSFLVVFSVMTEGAVRYL
ncbi:MAG: hypothetical protein ABIF18_00390 [archaeon]